MYGKSEKCSLAFTFDRDVSNLHRLFQRTFHFFKMDFGVINYVGEFNNPYLPVSYTHLKLPTKANV